MIFASQYYCAKNQNSNLLQMNYLKQFLKQHLPNFYYSNLQSYHSSPQFYSPSSQHNLFEITSGLMNLISKQSRNLEQNFISELFKNNLIISYSQLQQTQLVSKDEDSRIVQFYKKQIPFIYILMIQVYIRMILVYFETQKTFVKNEDISLYLFEIETIYPLLKTQVMFSQANIKLDDYIQFFYKSFVQLPINQRFFEVLIQIKEICSIMGSLQKTIDEFMSSKAQKLALIQSQDQKSSFKTQSKYRKKHFSSFDENQMFRMKKKKIVKQRFKNEYKTSNQISQAQKKTYYKLTPKTQKSALQKNKSQSFSPTKIFAELSQQHKIFKKPLDRTIYYSETKKFLIKKSKNEQYQNQQVYISNSNHLAQSSIKTEKKRYDHDEDFEISNCLVPETPKNQTVKKDRFENKLGTELKSYRNIFK